MKILSPTRRPSRINLALASATSLVALATAAPAWAQDAQGTEPTDVPVPAQTTAQEQNTTASNADQAIVITGIRGSLQRNLDIKRTSPGVVDVISAEDIGKFPDSNVAAALQRLPGVAIQRAGARGEATGVSIRGFGGDFVDTLYDGRHISTATGGRGVDFSTIGADFVGRLTVYKTPDVELSTSAIGGTIDVQMPKPFDRPGFHVSATASGNIQSRDKGVNPTAGLLVTDTFADDTFGILGDISYTRHDTTANHVFIPGWIGAHFAPCQAGPIVPSCTPTGSQFLPDPNVPGGLIPNPAWADPNNRTVPGVLGWFPQQQGIEQTYNKDERIDGRVAVQWRPSDNILLTIDDNYSKQTIHSGNFGYAAWFNGTDLRNIKQDSNGTVVDFNQFGTPMDFNANKARNIFRTNQTGVNLKWDINPNLTFDLDGAIAKSVRNPGRNGYNDSMDIGYGGTNGSTTVLGANTGVTILGPSSDYLPQIHDIGPAGDVSRFVDQTLIGSHVIVRGAGYNTDLVKQLRASLGWHQDDFSVKLGGQYIDDKLHGENESTFTNGVFASRSGYGPPSGRPGGPNGGIAPLPANVYLGTINVGQWIPGYKGSLGPTIIKYDPYAIYSLLEASGGSVAPSLDPGSVFDIHEKTWSIFFKASFDAELGGMPFHLNAGIRNENTHLTSVALGRHLLGLSIPTGDPTLVQPDPSLGPKGDGYSETSEITGKSSYDYLLPSIDAKLEVTPNFILRADASRTLTRPPLGNLKPNFTLGTLRKGSLSASGGNPNLKPYLSDNFDFGAEWYYQRNSYIAANFYLKHITDFIVGGTTTRTIDDVIDPNTGQVAQFNFTAQVNGPAATVKGVELALQHVFGDSGFGLQANATLPTTNRKYDKTNVSGGAFTITGLAKSANFVGFFDKFGIEARVAVNWRDEYLLQLGQGQGGTFGAEPVFVDKQLTVDASASYDITDNITAFVEGTNLTNSTYSTHGRFSNQVLDVWSYGRRFTFGARFHF